MWELEIFEGGGGFRRPASHGWLRLCKISSAVEENVWHQQWQGLKL
jgi:hypothetical protein